MSLVVYRIAGNLSSKSINYLTALKKAGWPDELLEYLHYDLIRFESASLQDDTDTAMDAFVHDGAELHRAFLEKLNRFVKAIARAERYEELQSKASGPGKDSIAANVLLGRVKGQPVKLDALKNSRVNLEKLDGMSDDEIKREIEATKERLSA